MYSKAAYAAEAILIISFILFIYSVIISTCVKSATASDHEMTQEKLSVGLIRYENKDAICYFKR